MRAPLLIGKREFKIGLFSSGAYNERKKRMKKWKGKSIGRRANTLYMLKN
jgi:hypothetical protein